MSARAVDRPRAWAATRRRRGETPVLDLLTSMTADSMEASSLDAETLMLVRIAALVAVDAPRSPIWPIWGSRPKSTSTSTRYGASSPRWRRSWARPGWRRRRARSCARSGPRSISPNSRRRRAERTASNDVDLSRRPTRTPPHRLHLSSISSRTASATWQGRPGRRRSRAGAPPPPRGTGVLALRFRYRRTRTAGDTVVTAPPAPVARTAQARSLPRSARRTV